MKIEEIEGCRIKIGKTSITIKDENDKTRGIVQNIRKFSDLRSNIQMDYFKQLREAGVWGV